MSTRVLLSLVGLLTALIAPPALAVEVFVNGVKVTRALVDTTLDVKQVRFDAQGNVFIEAPGYKIEVAEPPAGGLPTAPVAPPSMPDAAAAQARAPATVPGQSTTWLVINVPVRGHYKLHITANGQPVVELAADQPQYVLNLGNRVITGGNDVTVRFEPVKSPPAGSPGAEAVNVLVGEGMQGADGTLTISRLLGTLKHPTGRLVTEQHSIQFTASP